MALHSSTSSQTIKLAPKVLGGSDAVDFSQRIHTLASEGATKVVLDLSAVSVMNSSGLGMLVAAHSTMKRFGGVLSFSGVPENVMKLLRMTHLESVFHFEEDDNLHNKS